MPFWNSDADNRYDRVAAVQGRSGRSQHGRAASIQRGPGRAICVVRVKAGQVSLDKSVRTRSCPFQFRHHRVEVEARRLLPNGKFLEALQPLCGQGLHRHLDESTIDHPFVIEDGLVAPLERVGAQVEELRQAQFGELSGPYADALVVLLKEDTFPIVDTDRNKLTIIVPVDELLARRFLRFALEERDEIKAVEMDLEGLVADLRAASGICRRCQDRRRLRQMSEAGRNVRTSRCRRCRA